MSQTDLVPKSLSQASNPSRHPRPKILDSCCDILTRAVSLGIRDLSSQVQLLGNVSVSRGAISSIWVGKCNDNSRVAVKLLDLAPSNASQQEFRREFLREAQVWSAMHHENILPLLGIARLRNSVALISPWVEGGDLNAYVNTQWDANIEQLFADVARGLAYLHSQKIVYGNVRATTVLVSSTGRAYLSSFLAAHSQGRDDAPTILNRRAIAPEPLDPDEVERKSVTTPQSDVFEFGTTIMELLTDDIPPTSYSVFFKSSLEGKLPERASSTRGLTHSFWTLVRDCLQDEPMKRPAMAEVAQRMVQLGDLSIPSSDLIRSRALQRALKDISSEIQKVEEHPIAGGGFCDVYLSERLGSEKVALKLVRFLGPTEKENAVARRHFLTEAHLWAEFEHPHILEFYGICERGSLAFFMVSPFLKNGTIIGYLANVNSDADRYRLVNLLSEAAEGLLYVHSRPEPIVHGDLKGANILITDKGTAVLADFGLSKISYKATTTTFQNAGSPRWMAPELILPGGKTTSPRKTQKSDIYAYGHVILEVLSNELPFSDLKEEVHVIVELIRGGRSVRPDGRIAEAWLDDVAWAISRRCTAIDPEERPGIQSVLYDLCRLRQNTVPGQNRRPHLRE